MSTHTANLSHWALDAATRGLRTLKPGSAVTLQPNADGELRIARGAAWATVRGPHAGNAGAPGGDVLLEPGARIALRGGQALVLEPIATASVRMQTVAYDFRAAPPEDADWQHAVAEPAHELQHALAAVPRALGRLAHGLVVWVRQRMAVTQPAHCA